MTKTQFLVYVWILLALALTLYIFYYTLRQVWKSGDFPKTINETKESLAKVDNAEFDALSKRVRRLGLIIFIGFNATALLVGIYNAINK